MSGKEINLFIVIPAFNEHQVIGSVVNDLLSSGYVPVIVDDGSVPPLYELLRNQPVYYLRHKVNLGQGAALQTGIRYALTRNATHIATFDADGQHDPADLDGMLRLVIDGNADIVTGSRFLKGASHNMPAIRQIFLQLGRYFDFLVTGKLLTDAHNGLRVMNRKAAAALQITQNGMAHATEIISQVNKHHLLHLEYPVHIRYTPYSRSKGQSVWGSFRIFFDLLLSKLFK